MYTSKQNDQIIPFLFGTEIFNNNLDSDTLDGKGNFNNLVKQLVKLYREGTISEETLSALLKYTSSVYIESEITDHIEKAFKNRYFPSNFLTGLFG